MQFRLPVELSAHHRCYVCGGRFFVFRWRFVMDKFVSVLKSRKFWATLISLVFVVVLAIDPNFPLDEEQVIGIVTIAASYVIGTAIEGGWKEFGDVPSKLAGLLKSRKFWAAVVGFAVTMVQSFYPDFPLTSDQLLIVIIPIVSFIFGTAIEDRALHAAS